MLMLSFCRSLVLEKPRTHNFCLHWEWHKKPKTELDNKLKIQEHHKVNFLIPAIVVPKSLNKDNKKMDGKNTYLLLYTPKNIKVHKQLFLLTSHELHNFVVWQITSFCAIESENEEKNES